MHTTVTAKISLLAVLLGSATFAADEVPQSLDVTVPPPRAEFLILPLHVHILTARDYPDIDCTLADADIVRIIGKANGVWRMAGIVFRIESLLHEPAENVEQFQAHKEAADNGALGYYRMLAPAASGQLPGLHVYYVHQLPVNGVYLGSNICFIKETASLRPVTGGIDEPIPRVTSHELGHALGLPHRQNRTNLMASGTTGTILNEAEAAISRARAKKIADVMTPGECEAALHEAEKKNDKEAAGRLREAMKSVAE